ncbi:glycerophosphodiester phosphodiesterase [Motilibacter aurantiacus]|uniref:glycerophosphodiester phosphodiesterase n=1 Tax=Motilibacter aurantiacus TaxID=2714955 RepID=UPI00140AE8A8|nr:glycerophosphodiester phosphodiesterase [Motilibacter aurantiacus]NHC46557.1 glycerophosphodiester phosphodiesterase [Motilibacter aurantiacus]
MSPRLPLAVAHRAGNQLAALQQAAELGVDVIELDVHSWRGRLEVRHARTAGRLPILWDGWRVHRGWKPRLELAEVVAAALRVAGPGTRLMLDLKGTGTAVGHEVARSVHELAADRDVLVCGRHWPALEPFAALPYAQILLSARTPRELAALRARVADGAAVGSRTAYGASIHRSLLTRPLTDELHRTLQAVLTWPVNTAAALEEVLAVGATGVISDELDVLRTLLARRPA